MKNFTKICLILSGIIIGIGLILAIIGGIFGAGSSFVSMVESGRFSFWWNDNKVYNVGKGVNVEEEFVDINKLNIDLKAAELIIETTNENVYRVEAVNVTDKFLCREEDGELFIKDNIKDRWRIGIANNYNPTVTLFIPEGTKFEEASIDVGVGKVELSKLITQELDINIGAGAFYADVIESEEAEINVGEGQLEINRFNTNKVDMECGTGELKMKGNIGGDAKIESGIGNIELSLTNQESDFNYDLESGIGDITIGNQSYGGIGREKKIDNNSNQTMKIKCGVGSIGISFE